MSHFEVSEIAKDDLLDVWLDIYELTRNIEFADTFVDSFIPAFEKIARNPGIGESREYLAPNFRKWTHRKYIIYYTDQKDFVKIERILWGRRIQKI